MGVSMNTLLRIEWQDPHWWVWVLVAGAAIGLLATYGLLVMQFTRDLWGERITLNVFSPKRVRNPSPSGLSGRCSSWL